MGTAHTHAVKHFKCFAEKGKRNGKELSEKIDIKLKIIVVKK